MQALGLATRCIQTVSGVATGIAIVHSDENGEPVFHISRPAAFDRIKANTFSASTSSLTVDWIYFGTLLQWEEGAEAHIANLMRDFPDARSFCTFRDAALSRIDTKYVRPTFEASRPAP
jgi:sugar/nucleoside kinase (ribokinase family)